jgi:quinol monooxygenase YgiN
MADESVVVVNMLKVEPAKQSALLASLKENTDAVISTLDGWKTTRLIAAKDGAGIVIISEWETPGAVAAMRNDPRMQAYFPKVLALASLESMAGDTAFSKSR